MRWNLVRGLLITVALAVTATACVVRTRPAHRQRTIIVEKHERHHKHKKHKHHKHHKHRH